MNKEWLNIFSGKSLKVLYNLTFVMRCAFYTAVVSLLFAISQDLIAIRFTLDSLDRTIKKSISKAVSLDTDSAKSGQTR